MVMARRASRLIRAGTQLEPATLVPMGLVGAVVGLQLLSYVMPMARLLLTVVMALYLAVVVVITLQTVMSSRKITDAGVAFLIPIMHFSYGIAGWVELLRPGKDLSHTQQT